MTHWAMEEAFETESRAWEARADVIARFAAGLAEKQVHPVGAPPIPPSGDFRAEISGPYRVIAAWVPDWVPSHAAGTFVLRVDTLAKKAA